jgi:hypothetical protein
MQLMGEGKIRDETPAPGQKRRIFQPQDRLTDRRHATRISRPGGRRYSREGEPQVTRPLGIYSRMKLSQVVSLRSGSVLTGLARNATGVLVAFSLLVQSPLFTNPEHGQHIVSDDSRR